MDVSRRDFLKLAAAVPVGFEGLRLFLSRAEASAALPSEAPYGALLTDPEGIIDLPEGFSYQVISRVGEEMVDGLLVPAAHDGMAAFPGSDGRILLVRNHEVSSGSLPKHGAFGENNERFSQVPSDRMYDAGNGEWLALGGTTTLVYDPRQQKLESHYLSLAGTLRNCAGGPTPWGSWLTCEETIEVADDTLARNHGYVFEVPALLKASGTINCGEQLSQVTTPTLADPVPLKEMGRFNHEAVAVDPASGVVYLTEDRGNGLIYRFLPNRPGEMRAGGRLQAMRAIDRPGLDTRNWEDDDGIVAEPFPVRVPIAVDWIDLENVDGPEDDLRHRGYEAGAIRFARGEGMWYGRGDVYFACTNGGRARKGQVLRYTLSPAEGTSGELKNPGRLEIFSEPNDGNLVENCDNLTVSPWGGLVLCEDGYEDQYLVGVTAEGNCYRLGHNAMNKSEFAGATFSPDGETLFVNIQWPGLTLAITGPWSRGAS